MTSLHVVALKRHFTLFWLSFAAIACRVDAAGTAENLDVDEQDIEDAIDQARDLEVCGDMTAEEVATADAITASCRADIRKLLPPAENNASNRVFLLSHEVDPALDTTTLRVQGLDAAGVAIGASAFATASFSVAASPDVELTATVSPLANATDALVSVSVSNDYSASMLDQDLDRVAAIETDLFRCLPPLYEAEVTYFSTEIFVRQPFTEDADAILAAVARDGTFERQKTALYDGVGAALASLETRDRPVKLLVISSDGRENSSVHFNRETVLGELESSGALVLVLSALLADVDDMRALAGSRGVYFYTPFYDELGPAVAGFLDATKQAVEVVLDRALEEGETLNVEVDGNSYAVDL